MHKMVLAIVELANRYPADAAAPTDAAAEAGDPR
jgi:hypothetical protein